MKKIDNNQEKSVMKKADSNQKTKRMAITLALLTAISSGYDGEVSEPLVGRQGSRVYMRVARGSASLLPSHGRGIWKDMQTLDLCV